MSNLNPTFLAWVAAMTGGGYLIGGDHKSAVIGLVVACGLSIIVDIIARGRGK